ncbi:MAG TPA: hypothetical protein PLV92_22300, partial [Pirellulaceae bacterium]|nr:hypothetical protein [Pirellulaceae bacterium]
MTDDRRNFFQQVGSGLLGAALTSLLGRDLFAAESPAGAGTESGADLGANGDGASGGSSGA